MGGFLGVIGTALGTIASVASNSASKAAANTFGYVSTSFSTLLGIDPNAKTSTQAQVIGIAAALAASAAISVFAAPALAATVAAVFSSQILGTVAGIREFRGQYT